MKHSIPGPFCAVVMLKEAAVTRDLEISENTIFCKYQKIEVF